MKRTADEIRDELLVFRCQRRDADAWETLVSRWNAPLLFQPKPLQAEVDAYLRVTVERSAKRHRRFDPLIRPSATFSPMGDLLALSQRRFA